MKDAIDALDLGKLPSEVIPVVQREPKQEIVVKNDDKEQDFQEARRNIKILIERGDEALDGILDLARNAEHPRAYEVAATLIKTLTEANRDLLNLHKQSKDIDGVKPIEGAPSTVNNNLFVGSTADLQEMLKKKKQISG